MTAAIGLTLFLVAGYIALSSLMDDATKQRNVEMLTLCTGLRMAVVAAIPTVWLIHLTAGYFTNV